MDLIEEDICLCDIFNNEHATVNHVWCAGGHDVPGGHLLQQIPLSLG